MTGKPATVTEDEDGQLKVQETGPLTETGLVKEDESFFQHLMGYGGGWF